MQGPGCRSLTLLSLPLSNLCRETSLDGRDGPPRAAAVASNEVKTVLSLVELGIWGAASFAGYVFHNIAPQNVLNLFLLESTLDDQASTAVHGA